MDARLTVLLLLISSSLSLAGPVGPLSHTYLIQMLFHSTGDEVLQGRLTSFLSNNKFYTSLGLESSSYKSDFFYTFPVNTEFQLLTTTKMNLFFQEHWKNHGNLQVGKVRIVDGDDGEKDEKDQRKILFCHQNSPHESLVTLFDAKEVVLHLC